MRVKKVERRKMITEIFSGHLMGHPPHPHQKVRPPVQTLFSGAGVCIDVFALPPGLFCRSIRLGLVSVSSLSLPPLCFVFSDLKSPFAKSPDGNTILNNKLWDSWL